MPFSTASRGTVSPIQAEYNRLDRERGTKRTKATVREREIVQYVEHQVSVANAHRAPYLEEAFRSIALQLGMEHVQYDPTTKTIIETPDDDDKTPPANYAGAVFNTLVARSTESTPDPEVQPATTDEDDIEKARFSDHYLKWRRKQMRMTSKYTVWTQYVYHGLGVWKTGWNEHGGREVMTGPTGEVDAYESLGPDADLIEDAMEGPDDHVGEPGEAAEPYMAGASEEPGEEAESGGKDEGASGPATTGAPEADPLSIFEFGWDPGCGDDFGKARWAWHEVAMHVDEVRERWPRTGFNVKPEMASHVDGWRELALRRLRNSERTGGAAMADRVRVHEYYERPSPRHPRGFYACIAGGRLLDAQDYLPYGRLPFRIARHNVIPGRLPGRGAMPDIAGAQYDLARGDKDFRINLAKCGNTGWWAQEGSVVGGIINAAPGAVNEYGKGAPLPTAMVPPPPSPAHLERVRMATDRVWELSGISDISRGRVPSGLSGRAVGMLADLEASVMGPTIREMGDAMGGVYEDILRMTHDHMKASELVPIVGDGLLTDTIEFSRHDVRSFDVNIDVAAMMPRHLSWKREQVVMFAQSGVFGDMRDPLVQRRVRRALEFPSFQEVYGDNSAARRAARRDNERLRNGQWVEPMPWLSLEALDVVAEERMSFMMSKAFRMLDPQRQGLFIANLAWTQYTASQLAQGVPWWALMNPQLTDAIGVPLPPAMAAPQQPMEGEMPQPTGNPYDGPEQAGGAGGPGADDAGMAQSFFAQAMAAQQAQSQAMANPQTGGANGTPEMNAGIHGPGIADNEMGSI